MSERKRPASIGSGKVLTLAGSVPDSVSLSTSMRLPTGVPRKPIPMMPTTMAPFKSPQASPARNAADDVPCDQPLLFQIGAMAFE